jgi:glycosyltransferase involved in cell wall biosynthesis
MNRNQQMKTRMVYVLPSYDADSPEHLFHIYGFLEDAAEQLEILLVVERARGQPQFRNLRVHRRRLQVPLLGALEVLAVMLWARMRGYKRFYTHYSISAAILSALVTRFLGGVSYYWNCGHPLDFVPKHIRGLSALRSYLRNRILLGLALHLVHHLVTGTATNARYYATNYGLQLSNTRIMPNWVDLQRFTALPAKSDLRQELGWPADSQVVLFLHRLAERKGAHYLAPIARELLAKYPESVPNPRFVVVGDGPYRAQLEDDIHSAGLQGHFQLAGWVPNREAIRYLAAADVYMMPSTEEGFPRTLIEAMAAGCPFIATDVGGVRDILTPEQAQWIVAVGDVQGMAASIVRLLTDSSLCESLIRIGYLNVQNYSQDRVVQTFVSMVSQ